MRSLTRSSTAVATGVIAGAILRLLLAHGDWTLFFNPWFPLMRQPWA